MRLFQGKEKKVYMEKQGHWANMKKQASCLMKFDSKCMSEKAPKAAVINSHILQSCIFFKLLKG